jgi:creatinine amidohydrolase
MLQDRSRQWIRVVFAVVALVALGLATVALLNATVAVSEAQGRDHSPPFAPRRPTRTLKNLVYGLCASLARYGFTYVLICSYHAELGHLRGVYQGMQKAMRRHNMRIYEPSGPYFFNDEVLKQEPKVGFDTSKEAHGGFRETSLMKYQYPYLVDPGYTELQSIYRDVRSPRAFGKTFKQLGLVDGYIGSPARADSDYGRWFFQEIVELYVRSALDLHAGKKLPSLPKEIKLVMKSPFWL